MAHGRIFARFAVRNGATRLIEHRQNAPLKIARTFPSATRRGGLDVCVMDASPGLLGGDRHEYEWIVESGAQVRITTQGATRVHPAMLLESNLERDGDARDGDARDGGARETRQLVRARLEVEARLELWPENIIPFRGARFSSQNEIEATEGANLSIFECLSSGRIARGEVFAFEQVSLSTRIFDARGPLFCAQSRLVPAEIDPRNRFCFGEFLQWATLVTLGPDAMKTDLNTMQERLLALGIYGSASTLAHGGIALSMLGRRATDLRAAASALDG